MSCSFLEDIEKGTFPSLWWWIEEGCFRIGPVKDLKPSESPTNSKNQAESTGNVE